MEGEGEGGWEGERQNRITEGKEGREGGSDRGRDGGRRERWRSHGGSKQ